MVSDWLITPSAPMPSRKNVPSETPSWMTAAVPAPKKSSSACVSPLRGFGPPNPLSTKIEPDALRLLGYFDGRLGQTGVVEWFRLWMAPR